MAAGDFLLPPHVVEAYLMAARQNLVLADGNWWAFDETYSVCTAIALLAAVQTARKDVGYCA